MEKLIKEKLIQCLAASNCKYNQYIIKRGDEILTVASGFGHQSFRDEILMVISPQDIDDFYTDIRAGLSEEQINFCEEKGWASIVMPTSENSVDWEEYTLEENEFICEKARELSEVFEKN